MPLPAYIGKKGNTQSGSNVCGSVCDSVRDNPRISRTAEARLQILCAYRRLGALTKIMQK